MVLGFKVSHVKAGVQFFVGELVLLCIISPPSVWKALSLASPSITPVLAPVVYSLVMQHTLGSTVQFFTYYTLAAIVGGVLGLVTTYLVYAFNGLSYEPSVTKSATMVLLVSLVTFGVALLRFKHPWAGFAGSITCKSLVIVTLAGFHLSTVEPLVLLFWWIQVAVGVSVAALASFLVFPVTVGGLVQATTADSLRRLGQLTKETLEVMLSLELRADGRPAAATGNVQGPKAVDSGLEPMLEGLEAGTAAVLGNIESLRKLLALVATEWKVLHRLRQYLGRPEFPASTYHLLLLDIRSFLTALQMLVYPLQSGKMSLRDVQRAGQELQETGACLQACMEQLASCLESKQQYSETLTGLHQLEKLLQSMGHLGGWAGDDLPTDGGDSAELTADMVVAGLFLLGTRVRQIYFMLPEAIHVLQPDAREQRRTHFKRAASWDLREGGRLKTRTLVLTPKAGAGHAPASDLGALPREFPKAIPLPPLEPTRRERVILLLERAFRSRREQLAVALQQTLAVAVACILHVDTVTYKALHARTIWIVVTVIVVQESERGGVLIKSFLRVLGTIVGGGLGLGLMGLVALAAGGYSSSSIAKFATMCALLPPIVSIFYAGRARWPAPYGYVFTVVIFTTPLIALSGYQSDSTQWDIAWYRILMVLIGVGLVGAVAVLLFPRTSLGSARHRVQAALAGLSRLAELVLGSIVEPEPDQGVFGQRLHAVKVPSSKPGRPAEELSLAEMPGAAPGKPLSTGAAPQEPPGLAQASAAAAPAEAVPDKGLLDRPGNTPAAEGQVSGAGLPALSRLRTQSSGASTIFYDDATPRKGTGMRRQRREWLRQHVLGAAFSVLYTRSGPVATSIYNIGDLRATARFDFNPFSVPHVVPAKAIMAAQLACRRALNSILSLVYLFDSSDVPHVALLLPHAEEMEQVVEQVTACLLGMSRMAEGRCSLETTMPMVQNLCAQVAQLVVAVEVGAARQSADEADVVVGLAALGVLQTTCTSIQLIQAAVVGLFGTAADKERAEKEGLQMGLESAMEALLLVHLGRGKGSALAQELERAARVDAPG